MKCDRFWTLQTSRSLCGEMYGLLCVICWIRISRERLIFNKGGLFLNKGGLLENKRGLLGEGGARERKYYIEILIIDFTLKR